MRSKKDGAVGRPDHRAVDDPLDARFAHGRNALDRAHHVLLDPLQIVGEKLVTKALRRPVLGPEPHVALVGTDQKTLALLPQVVLPVAVRDRRQAAVERRDLGNGLGHEILVFCRKKWQAQTRHRPHFGCR